MPNQRATTKDRHIRLGLISQPGPICDATCATLARTPHIRLVAIASGALSATHLLPRVQPDLVLLDANLPEEEVTALLRWLAEHCPLIQILVATLTSGQLHQAIAFGADAAVRRDELPAKLVMVIDELLAEDK